MERQSPGLGVANGECDGRADQRRQKNSAPEPSLISKKSNGGGLLKEKKGPAGQRKDDWWTGRGGEGKYTWTSKKGKLLGSRGGSFHLVRGRIRLGHCVGNNEKKQKRDRGFKKDPR